MSINQKALNLLKTSKGQLEAVVRMVEEDRYCLDISNQILAVNALLKKANLQILENHIKSCIKTSFEQGDSEEKIKEVMDILDTYIK